VLYGSKSSHDQNGLRTFAIVFQKGDEVRKGLLEFARTSRFADAHLSGIGAFREVTMGFFDRQQKKYIKIPIKEQVEVLSFTGNIQNDGKPSLHAHVVIGSRRNGPRRTFSGWTSLASTGNDLVRDAGDLWRAYDDETGLALIRLAA